MELCDITDLIRWGSRGADSTEFFRIFNVPFPIQREIVDAITELGDLFKEYGGYIYYLSADETLDKRDSFLKLLYADIFGEYAISVKLAAEGYMKYSLRCLRASLDLLIAGLYTVTSWPPDSLKAEEGTNPMAEALFSGLWGKMEQFSIDDIVVGQIMIGEEGKGTPLKEKMSEAADAAFSSFIKVLGTDQEEMNIKTIANAKKRIRNALGNTFLDMARESGRDSWSDFQSKVLSPEKYYDALMSDDRFVYRSCKEHEGKMLDRLNKKFLMGNPISPESEIKLKSLTFILQTDALGFRAEEGFPTCDECEKPPILFAIKARPDNKAMLKMIKYQMPKEVLHQINECVGNILNTEDKKSRYFGDEIYSKIYVNLNDFAHSNIVEEPTISAWYEQYFKPLLRINRCILGGYRPTLGVNENQ